MEPVITPEIVVAYSQCPRKAYLLLFSPDKGEPHEYTQILEQQRCANQERYLHRLQQTHADVHPYSVENLRKGSQVLINAHLQVDRFAADCGVLTRVEGTSTFRKYCYEPSIFVGTHSISKEQQLELSFVDMFWNVSSIHPLMREELLEWTGPRTPSNWAQVQKPSDRFLNPFTNGSRWTR